MDSGGESDSGRESDSGSVDAGPRDAARPDAGCTTASCTALIFGLYFGPEGLGCSLAGVVSVDWQLLDALANPVAGYAETGAPCGDVRVGPVPAGRYGLRVSAMGTGERFAGMCTDLTVGGSGGGSIRYPCTIPVAP